jgi:hypothetical protein
MNNNEPAKSKTKIKKCTDDDIDDIPAYGAWKREDINNSKDIMPIKIDDTSKLTNLTKTNSAQGSAWNNAKTW